MGTVLTCSLVSPVADCASVMCHLCQWREGRGLTLAVGGDTVEGADLSIIRVVLGYVGALSSASGADTSDYSPH